MEKIFNYSEQAKITSPIVLQSNQSVRIGSSGTIQLRKNSKTGELIESFDTSSDKVLISAREIIVKPTNPLPYETEIHVVMSDGFLVSTINGTTFSGLDVNGDKEFKFQTEDQVGNPLEGGIAILKENNWYVVMAPKNSELLIDWNNRNQAIQRAERITGTSNWQIPTYWEMQLYMEHLEDKKIYWTSTEVDDNNAYCINRSTKIPKVSNKNFTHLIRTFKKVNF